MPGWVVVSDDPQRSVPDPQRSGPDGRPRASDPRLYDKGPTDAPEPWTDLQDFVALPRLTGLVTGPDGALLVAVSALDDDRTGYRSSWWRLDPAGARPARPYTRSVEGEGAAAFLPDGRRALSAGKDFTIRMWTVPK